MKKKPTDQSTMPETWGFAISMLQKNPKNPFPLTRGEIRLHSGCGSDVLTALHRMGDIRHFEHNGKMYPTLNENLPAPTVAEIRKKIREMNDSRKKTQNRRKYAPGIEEAIKNRERHEADTHPLSPTFLGELLEGWEAEAQRNFAQPLRGFTLSAAIAVITAAGGTVVFGDKKQ